MNIAILTKLPKYYSEQRLRAQGEARGHNVTLIPYQECYIALGLSRPSVWYGNGELTDIDAIVPRLTAGSIAYGAAIARQLESQGAYTTASSIALTRAFDRSRTLQILSRYDIKILNTVITRGTDIPDDFLRHLSFPVVISPVVTTKGAGPVLVESPKAVAAVLRTLSNSTTGFVIQQTLGVDSVDISAVVVGTKVVASVRHAVSGKFGKTTVESTKITDEESKVVVKAAKALGLTVCSVQFVRSEQGMRVKGVDAVVSLEMFEKATNRDVAGKIIEYIELNAKRRNKKDRIGA